jgi:hypothetical protein
MWKIHIKGSWLFRDRKVIISINSCIQYHLIHAELSKSLKILAKNLSSTPVYGEHIQFFKDLNITMDKYVLHANFHAIDMPTVDIILGYPWIKLVFTFNMNAEKKF